MDRLTKMENAALEMLPDLIRTVKKAAAETEYLRDGADFAAISRTSHDKAAARMALDGQIRFNRDAREVLCSQIRLLTRQQIYPLKVRRNTLLPIYQLPNEVLSRIFEFVVHCNWQYHNQSHFLEALGHLSRVSHLWRDIVLSSPRLWTKIGRQTHKSMTEFLRRSQQAPLDICYANWGSPYERRFCEVIQLALPHTNRMRSLRINVSRIDSVTELLLHPAPLLEDLTINSEERSTLDLPFGNTPRLRKLILSAIHIPLDRPTFNGLTELSLGNMTLDAGLLVFRVFGACPCLEVLELETVRLDFSGPDIPSGDDFLPEAVVIPLPCLRRILLESVRSAQMIHHLLSHIDTPALSQLKLKGHYDRPQIAQFLPESYINLLSHTEHLYARYLWSGGYPMTAVASHTAAGGKRELEFVLEPPRRSPFEFFGEHLALSNLKSVVFCYLHRDVWVGRACFLADCPAVEEITVEGSERCSSPTSLFHFLCNTAAQAYPCPRLRKLAFVRTLPAFKHLGALIRTRCAGTGDIPALQIKVSYSIKKVSYHHTDPAPDERPIKLKADVHSLGQVAIDHVRWIELSGPAPYTKVPPAPFPSGWVGLSESVND